MKICIVGCSGFIGSHLTERLLAGPVRPAPPGPDQRAGPDHGIIGVDGASAKIDHLLGHPRLEYHERNVTEASDLAGFVEESDVVVHLAAVCNPALYSTRPLDVIDASFTHTLPAVRLCRELGRRLIYFSTCEVYGKTVAGFAPEGSAFREDAANYVLREDETPLVLGPVAMQRWTYSCAKQLAERVIYAEGREGGLSYTIVRPFNFIGPRMDFLPGIDGEGIPRVFPCFMKALIAGEPLLVVDGGRSRRTLIYIQDAVEALVRVIERRSRCEGEILNIGNPDNETTIAGLARLMVDVFEEKTGKPRREIREVPARDFYGEGYDDCDRRVPDISKAERLLDWRPTTTLRALVEKTMDHYIAAFGDLIK